MQENQNIKIQNLNDEMKNSFMDYAMSVIASRALPDVRDGLKPVHRRILFAMNDLGNYPDKPYKKSARIVGDVIGKYHPHGDSSVYDAMVRMAQDFSYREPLVDGHGNFGSIDGDGAAAMRYTEARMSKLALELLRDINKNTIDFQENYDANELEPKVLPSKIPNLLINGSSGIAVGMATNIPPHNLEEIINGTIAFSENQEMTTQELMEYIKGPDFPLGAEILGRNGIYKAYETGSGTVTVRSKYQIFEEKNDRHTIIISEIPYQVNKARLIEKIADLVRQKRLDGIADLRDESDRDGMRIVIETKKNTQTDVLMNNLFKMTALQSRFSINLLALDNGIPKVLNLKEILSKYLDHQVEVIKRRTQFDLDKAEKRAHILEGLKIAIENIDEVIKQIKQSKSTEEAVNTLQNNFSLSIIQAKAILDMKLQKLTGLEINKLISEYNEILNLIEELKNILQSKENILKIIRNELKEIVNKHKSERRTIISNIEFEEIDSEELIIEENVIITISEKGYVKRISEDQYRTQRRGGQGSTAANLTEEDKVAHIINTSTHSDLLLFSDKGKVYKTRAHKIPASSKTAKGIPIINIIGIDNNEVITNVVSINKYEDNYNLVFVTKMGLVKKTKLQEYIRINKNGKIAIGLNDGDQVINVNLTSKDNIIFIATYEGKAIAFKEIDIRPTGRSSRGVTGIRFSKSTDYVIGTSILNENDAILTVSENGLGKITKFSEYRTQNRGGKGVTNLKITSKTGKVKAIKKVGLHDECDLMIITNNGISVRLPLNTISIVGRATQGVRLINLKENDQVANIEIIDSISQINVSCETKE